MMVANQAVRDFLAPATLAIWARMTALLTFIAACLLTVTAYSLAGRSAYAWIPALAFGGASIGLAIRRGLLLRQRRSVDWTGWDSALWVAHQISGLATMVAIFALK